MKLTDLSENINEWFNGSGPQADIVISSRVRLARNLAGYKFLSRCSIEEKQSILERLRDVILGLDLGDEISYVSVDKSSTLDRNFLVERHLISRNHAFGKGPRGVIIARHEFFTAMINEEDHLRMQVLRGGFQLGECYKQIDRIDDMVEREVDYAFSERYGYLTACPTNVGTGIRVSVMLHLPALKMIGEIDKFLNAARAMNLAVRGLFGEGSEAAGDFYQLSNQATLGVAERDVIERFEKVIVPEIVEYENAARKYMLNKQIEVLDDKVSRALALLQNANLISSQEALTLLSHLRLGLNMKSKFGASTPAIERLSKLRISRESSEMISIRTINKLFMMTLPAHLQINYGKSLDATHRDALRAQLIRSTLGQQ